MGIAYASISILFFTGTHTSDPRLGVSVHVDPCRGVVLEAVAFGSYLRDVETYVDGCDGRLLTPAPSARGPSGNRGPPGMIGSSK
jgi:hypothetical protein